jgi:hypothetical protein
MVLIGSLLVISWSLEHQSSALPNLVSVALTAYETTGVISAPSAASFSNSANISLKVQ